ncbi:beta-crystallin A4 [Platysternon megacephalum]|uniref:Beta-crystallin A4 n=1 Tax=Platysternon megacephalum TaxID=55544 RepID=A0A4D9ESU5_9SAUR|nr:beta-crystallin A4 [Platysternon megacephalum]
MPEYMCASVTSGTLALQPEGWEGVFNLECLRFVGLSIINASATHLPFKNGVAAMRAAEKSSNSFHSSGLETPPHSCASVWTAGSTSLYRGLLDASSLCTCFYCDLVNIIFQVHHILPSNHEARIRIVAANPYPKAKSSCLAVHSRLQNYTRK